jgi:hypothetical protein
VAVKRIQADEVLSRFLGMLDLGQDQYLIEAGGKPIAGLVPPWALESPDESRQALLGTLKRCGREPGTSPTVSWSRTWKPPSRQCEPDAAGRHDPGGA